MKAKKILLLLFMLALLPISFQRASALEFEGSPDANPNHFVWDIMANMQTPDDPDCPDLVTAALDADGDTPAEFYDQIVSGACTGLASMRTSMESGMGGGGESVETNLFDAADWHNVENLYFEHSTNGVPDGRISFGVPIDFMSYDFLNFMTSFGNNMESRTGYISLDADTVGGFANYGAVLTMYNVPEFSDPEILVDGEEDNEGVVSNLVYDRAASTITFSAAHFSSFEVVEKGEKASVSSWRAFQYTSDGSCLNKLKLIIRGKDFDKDAEVKIGNREALWVKRKSSKKIVAKFCLDKLLDNKISRKRAVSVINPDADAEKADKKINLKDTFYGIDAGDFNSGTTEGVKNIQATLVELGFLNKHLITGNFGSLTAQAVREFQKKNGLPETGNVGPLTKKKLEEKMK